MGETPAILIAVLAHNEEALIAECLRSLPLDEPRITVHVIVNGSSDATAARARAAARGAIVHEYREGGKARSWNRFLFRDCAKLAEICVFVDGDAVVAPGSIDALVRALAHNPLANAAAALPLNGRSVAAYRASTVRDHGIFGDLYALRGSFLARMKAKGLMLPEDLIGDDGLIGALAKTDLGTERDWLDTRVVTVGDAGFYMGAPARVSAPATWPMQYRRMINYSVRYFQNQIVSAVMRESGAKALPPRLSDLYPEWLPRFTPRRSWGWWWFDRVALARMSVAAGQDRGHRGPERASQDEA